MFDSIAPRYDLLNHLLSANVDRLWWRRAARRFQEQFSNPDAAVLDICCGTGDMTMALLKLRPPGARPILAADFSRGMLSRAAKKFARRTSRAGEKNLCRRAVPLEADALHLPLEVRLAGPDCVGLWLQESRQLRGWLARVSSRAQARRAVGDSGVQRAGGAGGQGYAVYFRRVLPAIGRAVCGKAGAYNYLSVGTFRRRRRCSRLMRAVRL
jgi:demethylmenaquinone methyltransferase/2-methoxy-6-polyprenyl-1,4-benzoquinol methylase